MVFAPLRPSLDVWALLAVLDLKSARKGPFTTRGRLALIGLLVSMRLFRIGEVVMPVYSKRPLSR